MENQSQFATEKATLSKGVVFGGVNHKEVILREEVLKDNFRELNEIEDAFGKDSLSAEEKEADYLKACVQFRRRIIKLGTLEGEDLDKITAKDYFEKLSSSDYMILLGLKIRLDKRLEEALMKASKGDDDQEAENAGK